VHIPRTARLLAAGVLTAFSAPSALAAPRSETGNCVSRFTTLLGQAGVAGEVIRFGAHDLAPFGRNVVSVEAHATLGSCPQP
jgi:hypothetical protein